MISAVSSIYGIDLLEDNIEESKQRMIDICLACYKKALKKKADEEYQNILRFILDKNIVQGDSLNGIDKIIFTEWALVGDYKVSRAEYSFSQMNQQAEILNTPLFASLTNDKGEDVFLPNPIKTFPSVYYRKLAHTCHYERKRSNPEKNNLDCHEAKASRNDTVCHYEERSEFLVRRCRGKAEQACDMEVEDSTDQPKIQDSDEVIQQSEVIK